MDFCSQYAPRLQEERKRLGLSQDAAGTACGVSREMWGKYERGKAAIAAEALACFSKAGANIEYVLTGERAPTSLTPDEQVLLDGYRALDPTTRRRMLAFMLAGMSTEERPQPASVTVKASGHRAQAAGRKIVVKQGKV